MAKMLRKSRTARASSGTLHGDGVRQMPKKPLGQISSMRARTCGRGRAVLRAVAHVPEGAHGDADGLILVG